MDREPLLEAVKIDRQSHSVAVATLGKPANDIERLVADNIRELRASPEQPRCCLLDGDTNCDRCLLPTDPALRTRFEIQHDDTITTIARKTCPTAPKFWHWKKIPLPIFVPREV